jgi:hypothetical protein
LATHSLISDASYEGLGGWSPEFEIKWQLTKDDLKGLGFHIKVVEALTGKPTPDQAGLHINPLEFIATIINMWLMLVMIKFLPDCATGYVVDILSDNTSALLWLKLTDCTVHIRFRFDKSKTNSQCKNSQLRRIPSLTLLTLPSVSFGELGY